MLRRIKRISMFAGYGKFHIHVSAPFIIVNYYYKQQIVKMMSNISNTWMLIVLVFVFFSFFNQFFSFLLIVLVAEIATGVYAFLNKDQLYKMSRESIKKSIQEEYGIINFRTDAFDTFQTKVRNFWIITYQRIDPFEHGVY